MDISTILSSGPVFALLGVLATVVVNYLIQKSKSGSEIYMKERITLSEDQENFKKSILNELKEYRTNVENLREEVTLWQEKAITAQEQKLILTEQVITLNHKVEELERTIEELQNTIKELQK